MKKRYVKYWAYIHNIMCKHKIFIEMLNIVIKYNQGEDYIKLCNWKWGRHQTLYKPKCVYRGMKD